MSGSFNFEYLNDIDIDSKDSFLRAMTSPFPHPTGSNELNVCNNRVAYGVANRKTSPNAVPCWFGENQRGRFSRDAPLASLVSMLRGWARDGTRFTAGAPPESRRSVQGSDEKTLILPAADSNARRGDNKETEKSVHE